MSGFTRRQLLQRLAGFLAAGGTVVLSQTVVADSPETPPAAPGNPAERADRLADELPASEGDECASFLNRAFRNGGGFRNGGFRNAGFRNNAFRNGGFRNGGFRNGAFRNF